MTEAVKIEDLMVEVEGRKILDCMNLHVRSGEVVAVTGSTGSGKSTLLKVIAGIIPGLYSSFKTSGHVSVCGYSPPDAVRRGLVAYVPQDLSAYFIGSTVGEELSIITTTRLGQVRSIVNDLVTASSRRTHELSDGQLYRLLLAAALGSGAKVLLLDEPTSHVDPWSLGSILKLLKKYCTSSGASAVIVDHRLRLVKEYADYVLELKGSRGSHVPTSEKFKEAPTGSEVIVDVHKAYFTYGGGSHILKGIDLEVREGESVGIVGRNGAGKTTLIKLLAGVLKPAVGYVHTTKPVFMIPQTPVYWFSRDTVRDEVSFYAEIWGFRGDIDDVLELFYLGNLSRQSPYSLSVGEARRLSLALAYVSGAKVLLLDEPSLGLDAGSRELLIKLVRRFCVSGSAVIAATHDIDLIKFLNRAYVLSNGVLEVVGNSDFVVA